MPTSPSAPSHSGKASPEVFEGGCHCGRVRFRVRVHKREALDCNCSVCTRKGFLHLIVSEADFTLLTSNEVLTEYRFNTGTACHMFCSTCGIHPFYRPRSHPDHWDVNVRCLDDFAMDHFAIKPFDGRNWEDNVESIRE